MNAVEIRQIFYSAQTQQEVARSGFTGLDNLRNERPDWREYWPMRNFLLANTLQEDHYYGFFSPAFGIKTGLDAAKVHAHIAAHPDQDVYLFSPMWDLSALFLNVFEQGDFFHPGLGVLSQEVLAALDYSVDLSALTMDSSSTVFCNYVVARPAFWREWLALGEKLYALAEDSSHPLHGRLNATAPYIKDDVQMKVFIMERLAPLILASRRYSTSALDPFSIRSSTTRFNAFSMEAIVSDALKTAHLANPYPDYLRAYFSIRDGMRKSMRG
ncbi:hypothetical protein [Uliginosibacterium sediminicola]|uniref:Uncharacterized protein n=1 Tax=Uliginosibacterium sediminicola TaxID=2024550 RepID=A0ABU9YZB4_9RHOO